MLTPRVLVQAILSEEDRLVLIRFGRDWDPDCMRQDEMLYKIANAVSNFCVIYLCDIDQVPDFNQMYGKYNDPNTFPVRLPADHELTNPRTQ